ncbi:hypothetical protein E4U43_002901 [Claviceps pusilla]|uniref:Peptidase S9 prolyl oligopeptidase catalytic domain-containing protein n=1 Tax=Claviceps pusilla TaxID=123648 RepID=A0A9P7SVT0_9HYPO|nr:hypothetical protein E4U43_002901 [Claviceps pusilla]
MRTPQHNPAGYAASAITNTTALQGVRRLLVAHGTADDNVHVQHTMVLVDQLVQSGAQNYDVLLFPDADHEIRFHGARRVLHASLARDEYGYMSHDADFFSQSLRDAMSRLQWGSHAYW